MFESPSSNQTNTSFSSSPTKNNSTSTSGKPKLAKTFSNKDFVALKSQFDSGVNVPSSSVVHNTVATEAKSTFTLSPKSN
jgi:hypothetical protein